MRCCRCGNVTEVYIYFPDNAGFVRYKYWARKAWGSHAIHPHEPAGKFFSKLILNLINS
jgi:predicted membrane chloride channel (bestrophin family)